MCFRVLEVDPFFQLAGFYAGAGLPGRVHEGEVMGVELVTDG